MRAVELHLTSKYIKNDLRKKTVLLYLGTFKDIFYAIPGADNMEDEMDAYYTGLKARELFIQFNPRFP